MASRYSSISSGSALSTIGEEKTRATSSSLNDGFSRHLLRPWSFARSSDVSQVGSQSELPGRDAHNSFDSLDIDRPPSYKPTGAWARFGDSNQEKGAEDQRIASGGKGWWKEQMLVDRSLRTMAGLTSLFAFIMVIICIRYMPDLVDRKIKSSTSVGSATGQDCDHLESTNVFLHLLINIAATLILGMSNTYQQLVTSLRFDEIRWVLSRHGDSRVGTNSPMNIRHKKRGKRKAWLSWLLLILTSLPIHLLANSVFGQSLFITSPTKIEYAPVATINKYYSADWACWVAFRTGGFPPVDYASPAVSDRLTRDEIYRDYFGASTLLINHNEANCSRYKNTTTLTSLDLSQEMIGADPQYTGYSPYGTGTCLAKYSLDCEPQDYNLKCRISVRMSAALTLTICLIIKATYMIIINVASRRSIKTQCLTFGDVIVASAIDRDSRIYNECMVNAGDGYRHRVAHSCHKHCKDQEPSATGDSIGHCQKCTKHNTKDKAADLLHPTIAIKYKKSLLSNLGSSALVQMIILMFCSISMLAVSILLAYGFGSAGSAFMGACKSKYGISGWHGPCTSAGRGTYLKGKFGTFGGFNSSASLPPPMDNLTNEASAFFIANGAQVLYSGIYLLLSYNLTLISMELDWGRFETARRRLRCTLVKGNSFTQSYCLQLSKKILLPMMVFSAVMHWLLGQAISARETVFADRGDPSKLSEQSIYSVVYGTYSIWFSTVLMMTMTGVCWWAFTYTREGFMPQMFGSIRACCAATTELEDFPDNGIQWGDLGEGEKFRHAGFSDTKVDPIVPGELYCGRKGYKSC